jgi:hypothetical protein
MKTIIVGLALVSFLGCASADQKIASKQGYRNAQVEAIKVQSEMRVNQAHAEALEKKAMWEALASVAKANPEAASNVAIVAAVAAAREGGDGTAQQSTGMALIKTERDVTALDWARVMTAPVLGTLTQVGIAAVNSDLQKEISKNNRDVNMKQEENRGKIFDVIPAIAGAAGSTITMTDSTYVGNDFNNDERVNYVIGVDTGEADDLIDTVIDETSSFGVTDEVIDDSDVDDTTDDTSDDSVDDSDVDDTTDDTDDTDDTTDDTVDCSEPQFSPAPPECQDS